MRSSTPRMAEALEHLRRGRPVLVSDDPSREDEADLVFAAGLATAEVMGFVVRHSSGVVCAPMPRALAQALDLPDMVQSNQDPKGTAYTVSCDAVGLRTGIGAGERAQTLRSLATSTTQAGDLTRPGHVFPLVAHPRGLEGRRGHTEAAVALTRLAGLGDVGAIAEVVGDNGEVLRGEDVVRFASEHGLIHLGIDEIAAAERWSPWAQLPSLHGRLRASVRSAEEGDVVWIETWPGEEADASEGQPIPTYPLVRLHSECVTGEAWGSLRCDCREQLDESLALAARGEAVVLYLRGHEGRGIGLSDKISAYALQDRGSDTVEANERLGRAGDERNYAPAALALKERGVTALRLLSNNPAKAQALRSHGLRVTELVPTVSVDREEARRYLTTKAKRMGHLLATTAGAGERSARSGAMGGGER